MKNTVIIPMPKRVAFSGERQIVTNGTQCVVLLASKPGDPERTAALELVAHFRALGLKAAVPVVTEREDAREANMVIALGTPASSAAIRQWARQIGMDLSASRPGREGYAIRFLHERARTVVLCGGSDATGAYYAAQTFKQLCRTAEGGVEIREARVEDWPTLKYRGMFVKSWAPADFMAHHKLNSWDLGYTLHSTRWRNPTVAYRRLVKSFVVESLRRGLNATSYVNPLLSRDWQYGGPQKITIASARDRETLFKTFRLALEEGARIVCLALDDFASKSGGPASTHILTDPEDRARFGTLGRAHRFLCQWLYERIQRDFPGTTLIVCPSAYVLPGGLNWMENSVYLREMSRLPDEVVIQWTGPSVRSCCVRREHLRAFARLIGRKPCYWDNSPYGQHLPPYYLFDLFGAWYYRGFANDMEFGMHSNAYTEGEINRVGIAQIADFMWNPEAYDAKSARRRALAVVAGDAAVAPLIRYHDVFQSVHDRNPHLFRAGVKSDSPADSEAYRETRRQLGELGEILGEIERRCPNRALTREIREVFHDPLMKRAGKYAARRLVKPHWVERRPEGILIPARAFFGGSASSKLGEELRVIWGRQNVCHRMRAFFPLRQVPRRDCLLSVKALDGVIRPSTAGQRRPTRIRIEVNGHVVFEGPSEFDLDIFWIRAYNIKKRWLTRGMNRLSIAMLENEFYRNFRLAWMKLIGSDR